MNCNKCLPPYPQAHSTEEDTMLRVHHTFLAAMLAACSDDEADHPILAPAGQQRLHGHGYRWRRGRQRRFPPLPVSVSDPLCRMWSKASTTTVTAPSGSSPQRKEATADHRELPQLRRRHRPETRVLDADEVSYATCGVCLVLELDVHHTVTTVTAARPSCPRRVAASPSRPWAKGMERNGQGRSPRFDLSR